MYQHWRDVWSGKAAADAAAAARAAEAARRARAASRRARRAARRAAQPFVPDALRPEAERLTPEEVALVREAAAAAGGLDARQAGVIAGAVLAGLLPVDPVALARRLRALAALGAAGEGGEGDGASAAAALSPGALVDAGAAVPLLMAPARELRRCGALLARLLPPAYAPPLRLMVAAREAALRCPERLAAGVLEAEAVFRDHLGAEFPRPLLLSGAPPPEGASWHWLSGACARTKAINVLRLSAL